MRSSEHLHGDAKWTVPNVFTALRILMAAVAAVLFTAGTYEKTAVTLCVVAALLDAFDGWYARTFSQCSKLGKHLDPLADKLLMAVVYAVIAVKLNSAIVWIIVAMIAARELGLTLFRAYSLRRYGVFIPANRWGKVKMVLQSTFGLVLVAYAYLLNGGFHFDSTVVAAPLISIFVVSYYSAIIYIKSWRDTIINRAQPQGAEHLKGREDAGESRRMVAGG